MPVRATRPGRRRRLLRLALVAAAAAVVGAAAVVYELGPGGALNPNSVEVRYLSWFNQDGNYLGDSSGADIRGGASFDTALSLKCPQWPLVCNSTEVLSSVHVTALGQRGWVNGFNVTASNLPLTMTAGGSALVSLTVQVPDQTFDGFLEATVNIAAS